MADMPFRISQFLRSVVEHDSCLHLLKHWSHIPSLYPLTTILHSFKASSSAGASVLMDFEFLKNTSVAFSPPLCSNCCNAVSSESLLYHTHWALWKWYTLPSYWLVVVLWNPLRHKILAQDSAIQHRSSIVISLLCIARGFPLFSSYVTSVPAENRRIQCSAAPTTCMPWWYEDLRRIRSC